MHGHECNRCKIDFDEKTLDVIASVQEIEHKIENETKQSLVYIAGYLARNSELNEDELFESTTFYHQTYGSYLDELDRGGLQIPTDTVCQWTIFCYCMFEVVKDHVCRNSLADLFMTVSNMHSLDQNLKRAKTLTNIFSNNHCRLTTPRSKKEPSQKVLKLSEK